MKDILLICPSSLWDEEELSRPAVQARYRFRAHGSYTADRLEDYDPLAFIDSTVETFAEATFDGILGTHDYPATTMASAIAEELGLRAPSTRAVLLCQHKYYFRIAGRASVPEATPDFFLIDPVTGETDGGEMRFPIFVKPVKSRLSIMARRIADQNELTAFLPQTVEHVSTFMRPFNALLRRYTDFARSGSYLIAEDLLRGVQVTVDGYVCNGVVGILGVTDSVMYPGTNSFSRFDYPSHLPRAVQERASDIASRLMKHIGYDNGMFDMEMFYDAGADALHVIEVNPRMSYQFADIFEKVDGINSYDVQLAIITGDALPEPQKPTHRCASSYALRSFTDAEVIRTPTAAEIAAVKNAFPETRVRVFAQEGRLLSDKLQDPESYLYAIVNVGGDDRADVDARFSEIMRRLPFEFRPIERGESCAPPPSLPTPPRPKVGSRSSWSD